MTIVVDGKRWKVPDVQAARDSRGIYLLACQRCGSVCVFGAKCECCRAFEKLRQYPDDGKHHVRLLEAARFRSHPEVVAA